MQEVIRLSIVLFFLFKKGMFMFKKTLVLSLSCCILVASSLANAQTYSKDNSNYINFVKTFNKGLGKAVSIDLGSSEKDAKINIKGGTCQDYLKVMQVAIEMPKHPQATAEQKDMLNRLGRAAARKHNEMNCKL